jgi:hypothetical protein
VCSSDLVLFKLFKALEVDANYLFQDEMKEMNKQKNAPTVADGGEYQEYIDLIKRLPPEQRIEVKGYLKHLVYEYEASPEAKQTSAGA